MANSAGMSSTPQTAWSSQDLIRRLCHALDIASLAIEHLAPEGFRPSEQPGASIRREKPIGETAVLLYAASLAPATPEIAARLDRVARQLIPYARNAQMKLNLILHPALAIDFATAHLVLTRLGYPDAGFAELLNRSRRAQGSACRERTPHRVLEQQWLASLGDPARSPRRGAMGILSQPLDLLGATNEDLYAFTHAIMYTTRFVAGAATLPRSRRVILAEAEAALTRCLDRQDYDLCAELLLTWPLTRAPWSPAAAFAFRVLTEVEDRAGFLPTPATRIAELNRRTGSDRTRYLLATSYHTIYAMGLLCAVSLQSGCAPPAALPAYRMGPRRTERLLTFLEGSEERPHWRETFANLASPQAEALAGMIFDGALQRFIGQRNFDKVDKLLRRAYELDLADSPCAGQAAELLERVALLGDSFAPRPRAAPPSELFSAAD